MQLSSCAVQLMSAATEGGAVAVDVALASPSLAASVPFDVWHPGSLSLEVGDTELSLLDGCTSRYEWTRLWLRASSLDGTPLGGSGDLESDAGVQLTLVAAAAEAGIALAIAA